MWKQYPQDIKYHWIRCLVNLLLLLGNWQDYFKNRVPRGSRFLSGLRYWSSVQSRQADPVTSPSLLPAGATGSFREFSLEGRSDWTGASPLPNTQTDRNVWQSRDKALGVSFSRNLFAFFRGLSLYLVHDSVTLCMLGHSLKDWHDAVTGAPNGR